MTEAAQSARSAAGTGQVQGIAKPWPKRLQSQREWLCSLLIALSLGLNGLQYTQRNEGVDDCKLRSWGKSPLGQDKKAPQPKTTSAIMR